MMRVIWSPQAIEDAAAISAFISRDAPAASVRWLEQLFSKAAMLAQHPLMGGVVDEDEKRRYRQVLQGNYRIIYRVDDQSSVVRVIAVIHAARLLPSDRFA